MSLADENASMVNGLGESELEDESLKTTLQEIRNLKGEHVIELSLGLIEDTKAKQTTEDGGTLEQTTLVMGVESEQLTIKQEC